MAPPAAAPDPAPARRPRTRRAPSRRPASPPGRRVSPSAGRVPSSGRRVSSPARRISSTAGGGGVTARERRAGGPWDDADAPPSPKEDRGTSREASAPRLPAPDWTGATRALSRRDPTLRAVIRRVGPCTLAPRENSFGALAGAIVAQQISAAAATTIHRRLWKLTGGRPPRPEDLLRRRETTLRRVGLSRQKIGYLRDLARRVRDGDLDFEALLRSSDDEVRETLTAVRGIGDWTADMHLIFTLNRPDVFAPGDAAVLAAMRDLYDLPDDAPAAAFREISDRWRPYRSVGVWYMYEHLHARRREARRSS